MLNYIQYNVSRNEGHSPLIHFIIDGVTRKGGMGFNSPDTPETMNSRYNPAGGGCSPHLTSLQYSFPTRSGTYQRHKSALEWHKVGIGEW